VVVDMSIITRNLKRGRRLCKAASAVLLTTLLATMTAGSAAAATPTPTATPAGPPRAGDGQHLGLQPAAVQALFRATHGDGAEARWVAQHDAELVSAGP
jgi:hypothetical protein